MNDKLDNTTSMQEAHDVCAAFSQVREQMLESAVEAKRAVDDIDLIVVSKNFNADAIRPVLEQGQRKFGENRVQEAQAKWPQLRDEFANIELHLIGPLQSNKAGEAVALFDVIESVDREKIAATLSAEMIKKGKSLPCYVQVNTGLEPQKAGIAPQDTLDFVRRCQSVHALKIIGLMCIPPADENPGPHFALLEKLCRQANLSKLSMGMSGDFDIAIKFGATSIRVGSAIFGNRSSKSENNVAIDE